MWGREGGISSCKKVDVYIVGSKLGACGHWWQLCGIGATFNFKYY